MDADAPAAGDAAARRGAAAAWIRREIGLVGAFAALTVATTWPLAGRLASVLPGRSNTPDYLAMLWYCRWMADALRHGWNPYRVHTAMLPTGCDDMIVKRGPCFVHALTVPLQALGGLVVGFNLTALLLLTFNLWAAHRLVLHLVRHRGAAFLAAAALAFHPWLGHEFWHGHLEEQSIGFCLLFVLCLLRTLDGGTWRDALGAGVTLFLAALTYLGFAQILLVLAAVLFLHRLIAARGRLDRACLGRLALAGLTFSALMTPLLSAFAAHSAATALPEREAVDFSLRALPASIDSLSLGSRIVVEGSLQSFSLPPWGGRELRDLSAWLTGSSLVLAAIGTWLGARGARVWLAAGAVALVLACGPFLVCDGGGLVPLPGLLLYEFIPFFSRFRFPYRLLAVLVIALTVLSGFGWRALLRRVPARAGAAPIALGLLLLGGEYLASTRADLDAQVAAPPPFPQVYVEHVAAEDGDFGIVTVPIVLRKPTHHEEGQERRMSAAAYEIYHQIAHRKRILGGRSLSLSPPPAYDRFLRTNSLLAAIERWQDRDERAGVPVQERDLVALAEAGFRYVVVEASFLHERAALVVVQQLTEILGTPVRYPMDAVSLFRLDGRGPARGRGAGGLVFPRRLDHGRRLGRGREAVARAPADPAARLALAEVLLEGGELDEAAAQLEAAAALDPGALAPWAGILRIAVLQRQPAEVLRACDAILALDPAHPEARRERAIAALQIRQDAAEPAAARRIAAALLEADRPWDALDALQRAAGGGADARTEVALADAWDALGLPARALAHRRRALALDPTLDLDLSAADLPAVARPVDGP